MQWSAWLRKSYALVLLTLVTGAALAVDAVENRSHSTEAKEQPTAPRWAHDHDAVLPLSVLENVDSDVDQIVESRRRIIERCKTILHPATRHQFEYKQRAGAARILGEFGVSEAVPLLFVQLVEDADHAPAFISDLDRLTAPAFDALFKISEDMTPGSIEVLRHHGRPILQKQCVTLMHISLLSLDAVQKALEEAIARESDPENASRLRAAFIWAGGNLRDETPPATDTLTQQGRKPAAEASSGVTRDQRPFASVP